MASYCTSYSIASCFLRSPARTCYCQLILSHRSFFFPYLLSPYILRHHNQCVLFAGKGHNATPVGQRNAINYLSIYDNKLLRKFRGHSDVVTDISMSPADDTFLSSSKDRTVRLWNIQQAGSLAQLELPANAAGTPHAAFDSTGLVFAVTATMADKKGQVGAPICFVANNCNARFLRAGACSLLFFKYFLHRPASP